ncbi:MAG: signal recognition particle [Planctomycetes bacterium DG_23]|nr:MAG: signal recognition particle [Planctomycetes bacterium DG_23]
MFEAISKSMDAALRKLRLRGRLTEKNIRDGMREVRTALLQADVNFQVVRDFIDKVTERAVGEEVLRSVSPGEQVVKIVQDELEALMGPADASIPFAERGPTILMLAGLQGSGKTTTCAKMALYLSKQGKHPMLVAADVRRPAAIDQLEVLGGEIEIPVYLDRNATPIDISSGAIRTAQKEGADVLILDTQGRLHIDMEMMNELKELARRIKPHQIYLVADAMTGQDAVNSADAFNNQLELDGVILTKLDGDARGGAALSIKAVTGKPIKFVGTGEKLDRLEEFHPGRMASRILGMGDVVTLVERAQAAFDQEQAAKLEEKVRKATLTLDDLLGQMRQMRKMGPLKELVSMLPGAGRFLPADMDFDETQLTSIEAIIQSMTPQERAHPEMIDLSRRRRIALGSGTQPQEISGLVKQFRQMRDMMKLASQGEKVDLFEAGMPGRMPRRKMRSKRKRKKDRKKKKRR